MGFTHMRLVAQNAPYIVLHGPFTRLDLNVLYIIAWHINEKGPDNSRWISNAQLKSELRIRPAIFDGNIKVSINRLVDLGLITVKVGAGKKASVYTLTDKIMLPELISKNGATAPQGSHQSDGKPQHKKAKAKKAKAEKVPRGTKPAPESAEQKPKKKLKYKTRWMKRQKAEADKESLESKARVAAAIAGTLPYEERSALTDDERDAITLATRFAPLTKKTREQAEQEKAWERQRKRELIADGMSE